MKVYDALFELGLSNFKFRSLPFLELLLERQHRWSLDVRLCIGRPLPVERKNRLKNSSCFKEKIILRKIFELQNE